MSRNRAIVLYGVNDYRVEKREIPEPGIGEIVVRIEYSGLCPSDIKIIRHGGHFVRYPVVLGHEMAGVVHAVGDHVAGVEVGEKVTVAADIFCGTCRYCRDGRENLCENPLSFGYNIDGGHADYLLVPRSGVPKAVFKLPDDLSTELASLTEPLACVVHSMNMGRVSPGTTVAIVGDGPMSLLHVLLSRIYGARSVAVLGLVDRKLEIAQSLGADRVYNRKSYTKVEDILRENPEGFNRVFLTVVNKETLEEAFKLVGKGGYIVVFAGVPAGSVNFTLDPNVVHYDEVALVGSYSYTYAEYKKALVFLRDHQGEVSKIISHKFNLDDFEKAVSMWDNKEKSLKIILTR
uniref:Enoyl reductase (ER) domain-containing protein n=1 Tax=Thermofilum pendens TaxID=2269 RepID=A0A7C4B935_THEPE